MKRFLNFIKNILVIAVLAGFVYGYRYQIQEAAQDIALAVQTINNKKNNFETETTTLSENDNKNSSKHTTGYKWAKPEANVYIDVKNNNLYKASVDAMQVWNNTGAFTFKQVNKKGDAQITINTISKNDGAAGLTGYSFVTGTHRLLKATVSLNKYYLLSDYYNYSQSRIINTAEHELGHAIGLDHYNGVSVMYPTGSGYTIQPRDVNLVKKIYHEE